MPQIERNKIENDKFTLAMLCTEEEFRCDELKNFDCGKDDLNEFFREDAFDHKKQLLAETYYFQPKEAREKNLFFPVAFISYLNDSITITKKERKTDKRGFWGKIQKAIPNKKRFCGYPFKPSEKYSEIGSRSN